MTKTERRDLDTEVTEKIVAALESGTVPWFKPWSSTVPHHNPKSGTVYRGINPFLLELAAMAGQFGDPRWVTFKQAIELGGAVRKGEKGALVVFWKMLKKRDKDTGEEKMIPLLRHYTVFNVAQCDGLELEPPPAEREHSPLAVAEYMIEEFGDKPQIVHGTDGAYYAPVADKIGLPRPESFVTDEAYYATAFHELAHSTGHKSRLNRPEVARETGRFGDDDYSREELTAELAAALLCGQAGIDRSTQEQSAAYLAHWVKVLKGDSRLVIQAAGKAQKAADYIRGETAAQQAETTTELAVAA